MNELVGEKGFNRSGYEDAQRNEWRRVCEFGKDEKSGELEKCVRWISMSGAENGYEKVVK